MGASSQNKEFVNDKTNFFMQLPKGEMEKKIDKANEYTTRQGYTFLLQNQKSLEDEFNQLFEVLQKQKEQNKEAFWLYSYYCASLLEIFYKAYSQQSKEEEYKRLKLQIMNHLLNKEEDSAASEKFIEHLKKSFRASFYNLINAPVHVSKIRDYVAYLNLCRLYWVFCRLSLVSSLTLAKALDFIAKLDSMLGTHTDVDKIISTLQAPNQILNYLSVGFFVVRFMIDAGLLVKHTFFPTEGEKKDNTTALMRFKYELYKRHGNFANDFVWATVNFITNFNHITHIPSPIAGAITSAFLGFDVCMTLYKCMLAKREYLAKKEEYLKEKRDYHDLNQFQDLDDKTRLVRLEILDKQLSELEISWRTKQGTFYFVAAGAAFLMFGFTSAIIFSPPGIVVASFFTCTLAVAMYLSSGAYSKYCEKSIRLEHEKSSGEDCQLTFKEYQAARDDFIYTIIKNTIMPPLLIATFALYWPAAVALTVLCLGYEIYHGYNQHQSTSGPSSESTKELIEHSEDNKVGSGLAAPCC